MFGQHRVPVIFEIVSREISCRDLHQLGLDVAGVVIEAGGVAIVNRKPTIATVIHSDQGT